MKFKLLLRLMTAIAFITSFASTTIDAGFFDNIKKHVQKAAHGPIGQMALQVGGTAVTAKYGNSAGALFSDAAKSAHLADEEKAAADEADDNASKAADAGDERTAKTHKAAAAKHRATAAKHTAIHETHKNKFEETTGANFDDVYEKHVGSRIKEAAKQQPDEEDDSDYAANDEGASDSDADDDEGADDESADDEDEE